MAVPLHTIRIFFSLLLISISCKVIPQTDTLQGLTETIEWVAEQSEAVLDENEAAEEIAAGSRRKVCINARKESDYLLLPFLNPTQRKSLQDYITLYGDVISPQELLSIPGFDSTMIHALTPHISFEPSYPFPKMTPGNLLRMGRYEILFRFGQSFPRSAGYLAGTGSENDSPVYSGNPHRYVFRFTYQFFDRIRLGVAGEKDPGEQFFRGSQSMGFDQYSGYLVITGRRWLKHVTLGSFRAGFGEGLVLGGTGGWMSGPSFTSQAFRDGGIRATFTYGDLFACRGAGATLRFGRIELSALCSYRKRDGRISSVNPQDSSDFAVSSLITGGYHRTASECKIRNNVTELLSGGNLTFMGGSFRIGLTGYHSRWSVRIDPGDEPYRRYQFRGNENLAGGLFFRVRLKRIYSSGEIAFSRNGGLAGIIGAELQFTPEHLLYVAYRNYSPRYQSPFARAFGRNSGNVNEEGLFIRMAFPLRRWLRCNTFLDLYRNPWLRFRVDAPSDGYEAALLLDLNPTGKWGFTFRYRSSGSRINVNDEEDHLNHLTPIRMDGISSRLKWEPALRWTFDSRIEFRRYRSGDVRADGFLFQQQAGYRMQRFPFQAVLLFSLFEIPDWNARIMVYEPEISGAFSAPAYQGDGLRAGVLLRAGLSRHLDVWIRLFVTRYSDREKISSGNDAIDGNSKADFSLQLVLKK